MSEIRWVKKQDRRGEWWEGEVATLSFSVRAAPSHAEVEGWKDGKKVFNGSSKSVDSGIVLCERYAEHERESIRDELKRWRSGVLEAEARAWGIWGK